jgi:RimJ/RimL family protein N-acetyltransferase
MNFETERLRVSTLAATDYALFCQLYCDSNTMALIGPPLTPEKAEISFALALKRSQRSSYKQRFMRVALLANNSDLGICGFTQGQDSIHTYEPGLLLLPHARAQGFAFEVLSKLCDLLFTQANAEEIWLQYRAEHSAADRLVRRLGFTVHANVQGSEDSANFVRCRGVLSTAKSVHNFP